MKRINRIVSSVVLTCFLLNTAVSDLAFGQSNYKANADTLAQQTKFSNLQGIQAKDLGDLELWFAACLNYMNRHGFNIAGQTAEAVRSKIEEFANPSSNLPGRTIFQLEGSRLLTSEIKIDGDILRMKAQRHDLTYGTRRYIIEYSASSRHLDVYPEGKSKGRTESDRKAIDRYKENNERIVAEFIRERLEAGDFTEFYGRAKELGWDEKYPDRIKPEKHGYWPNTILQILAREANDFLSIFGLKFEDVFKGKNFVFINVPHHVHLPVIYENGQPITVHARTSNNAVYFFLTKADFNAIQNGMDVPAEARRLLRTFIFRDLIHEAGNIGGLEFKVSGEGTFAKIENDLDRAYISYLKKSLGRPIESLPSIRQEIGEQYKHLRGLKPVDLNTNLVTRDYAAAGQSAADVSMKLVHELWYLINPRTPVTIAEMIGILREEGLVRAEGDRELIFTGDSERPLDQAVLAAISHILKFEGMFKEEAQAAPAKAAPAAEERSRNEAGQYKPEPGKSPADALFLMIKMRERGLPDHVTTSSYLDLHTANYEEFGFTPPAEDRRSALRTIERDLGELYRLGLVKRSSHLTMPSYTYFTPTVENLMQIAKEDMTNATWDRREAQRIASEVLRRLGITVAPAELKTADTGGTTAGTAPGQGPAGREITTQAATAEGASISLQLGRTILSILDKEAMPKYNLPPKLETQLVAIHRREKSLGLWIFQRLTMMLPAKGVESLPLAKQGEIKAGDIVISTDKHGIMTFGICAGAVPDSGDLVFAYYNIHHGLDYEIYPADSMLNVHILKVEDEKSLAEMLYKAKAVDAAKAALAENARKEPGADYAPDIEDLSEPDAHTIDITEPPTAQAAARLPVSGEAKEIASGGQAEMPVVVKQPPSAEASEGRPETAAVDEREILAALGKAIDAESQGKYQLFAPDEFFKNDEEFDGCKRDFGNRFILGRVFGLGRISSMDPKTIDAYIDQIIAQVKVKDMAIALVPQQITEQQRAALKDKGIRYIPITDNVMQMRGLDPILRNNIRTNIFSMMYAMRYIKPSDKPGTTIYETVKRYVEDRLQLPKGMSPDEYVNAIVNDLAEEIIRACLAPIEKFSAEAEKREHDNRSYPLIFA